MGTIAVYQGNALAPRPTVAQAGQAADRVASAATFRAAMGKKSLNTQLAYRADLETWRDYLLSAGLEVGPLDFYTDPDSWAGVTFGLVEGFKQWLLKGGFAVGTVNRKVACVRTFCKLATKAGAIPPEAHALIQTVELIGRREGQNLDARRAPNTRKLNSKNSFSILLTKDQVSLLKDQPDSPQGRRDRLIMCLLLDHGLRVGELAALRVEQFDLEAGTFTFWREKVGKGQTHKLTADTMRALILYGPYMPKAGLVLRPSWKGGELMDVQGITRRGLSLRVRELGEAVGVDRLSAHDLRHTWATYAAQGGTDPFALRQAGGWNSITTVSRYVEGSAIANEGVKLAY